MEGSRTTVFISYSHKDEQWLAELRVHLKPFIQSSKLNIWDDTMINVGDKWKKKIEEALEWSRIAILLISPDFLASDFISAVEMPTILNNARRNGILIIGVILSPCWIKDTVLCEYQLVNTMDRPIAELSKVDRDRVWLRVLDAVREQIDRRTKPENITFASIVSEDNIPSKNVAVDTTIETAEIELTLDINFEDFTDIEKAKLLERVSSLLEYGDVTFKRKRRGSTKVTLELPIDLAEKLLVASKQGELSDIGVQDAEIVNTTKVLQGDYFKFDPLDPKIYSRRGFYVAIDGVESQGFEYWAARLSEDRDARLQTLAEEHDRFIEYQEETLRSLRAELSSLEKRKMDLVREELQYKEESLYRRFFAVYFARLRLKREANRLDIYIKSIREQIIATEIEIMNYRLRLNRVRNAILNIYQNYYNELLDGYNLGRALLRNEKGENNN